VTLTTGETQGLQGKLTDILVHEMYYGGIPEAATFLITTTIKPPGTFHSRYFMNSQFIKQQQQKHPQTGFPCFSIIWLLFLSVEVGGLGFSSWQQLSGTTHFQYH